MFNHIAETFVPHVHAECVAEKLCARTRDYCLSIGATRNDRLLSFEEGRAILRPTVEGLYLRVEARDLDMFYGIRIVLQANLSAVTTIPDGYVEWQPGGRVPFGAFGPLVGNGRSLRGNR